ncbi:bacteriocin [Mixta intestinalis]|uniref:Bacteriocin n=1 Tax=Mixta intestinalis TaxID=1615494 RepID=A0A6P1PTQ9_9GAMM|nr:bacteriocin [Mixta intestinalis]QHM69846.1 hypothetical protein C7M51_00099 [Mixta intestinalis]
MKILNDKELKLVSGGIFVSDNNSSNEIELDTTPPGEMPSLDDLIIPNMSVLPIMSVGIFGLMVGWPSLI